MALEDPTSRFHHLFLELERACDDPASLRLLRREIASVRLPADERAFLLATAGQYEHGCMPAPVLLYDEA